MRLFATSIINALLVGDLPAVFRTSSQTMDALTVAMSNISMKQLMGHLLVLLCVVYRELRDEGGTSKGRRSKG